MSSTQTLGEKLNLQFAFAAWEEIGRFGSRVLVTECAPDILVAVDVNHDYEAAPRVSAERYQPLTMGRGMTLSVGAISSGPLNALITKAAASRGIPVQRDVRGSDTGTDAMAGVLTGVDCAATSVGFPIRNMHTISELAHTGDVLASLETLCVRGLRLRAAALVLCFGEGGAGAAAAAAAAGGAGAVCGAGAAEVHNRPVLVFSWL